MIKKVLVLVIIFTIFLTATAYSQNPLFENDRSGEEKVEKQEKVTKYPAFIHKFILIISKLQKVLRQKLSDLAKSIKEKPTIKTYFWLILFAFLYGVIHALGPGHGKFIALSYFMSEDVEIKKGIIVGSSIAFLHAGSGFAAVMILYKILNSSYLKTIDNVSRQIQLISYGLIALVGLVLIIKNIFFNKKNQNIQNISNKSMLSIILAIGLVPCPGAVILTLFSISINSIHLGALMVLAMAAGMALTISLIGIVTILLKKGTLGIFASQSELQWKLTKAIQIFGSSAIVLIGTLLFFSNM
jgi:ABC-type nickel/cobalt efflux system permease component RcnA